ncbi:MAG TPA: sulfite oxidase-like oxidoreductase [Candidatus Manganitrophaceae bacterium]|nr:sulfite oxidase-like oxidoreductase [Candidatus Manganitrophaceae bacterium]
MEPKEKLISKKEEWAREGRGLTGKGSKGDRPRLPPGQKLNKGFPVLDLGILPEIEADDWTLSISGEIENPLRWQWEDFNQLAVDKAVTDFHCVTTWSIFDAAWEGISFKNLLRRVAPKPEANYLFFTSYDGYSTNLPLSVCDDDDVMLVHKWNGRPLPKVHGGPVRMVVPKRYAWKSAKWIKEIIFMKEDRLGFWEVRGYSNTADPWTEDRYAREP